MLVKQLSVFLENKPGRLLAAIDKLAESGIDISALSLADTAEFGILRLIVDDPEKAKLVLAESGVVSRISDVIAVAMADTPGGAGAILKILSENGFNIEYMYACVGKVSGKALSLLRVERPADADELLRGKGFAKVNPAEIYRI
ncbi:MAG: acetolactate synthase [Clostridia bacterium]|nr:acetolactate synthase [Clostridia bacterium]